MPITKKTTKTTEKKAPAKAAKAEKKVVGSGTYLGAVGRRKTAVATVKLWIAGKGEIAVNDVDFKEYFGNWDMQEQLLAPLKTAGLDKADIAVRVSGGGLRGQADAARLGISRAILKYNEELRKPLRAQGFLTRDPRKKERKKPGLRRARKSAQWSKR